jgi:hypothetical protein
MPKEANMIGRRKFLTILGGGVVVAAAGVGAWAATRDPAAARAPWGLAGQESEPRRKALSYAVLAPNPHNRQPWVADLSVADEITLYCQADRRLPHTDPFDRQITIGLGCFSELLVQAAAEDGYRAELTMFPDGEPQPRLDDRPVARFRFVKDAGVVRDPLFAHVLERRSNKEAYDLGRPVDPALAATIAAAARTGRVAHTLDAARVAELRGRAWDALYTEMTTHDTAKESIDLMRIGRAEIEANPDGIDLGGALIEGLATVGLLSRADMLDASSTTFQQQVPIMKEPFDTAMGFMWLTTPGNSRADQFRAGRDHVRMNLAATGLGVDMHPFSQALQEFPEMKPHFDGMRAALGIAAEETLQMLVRLGYGPRVQAGPRWPYETRIRSA